MWQFVMFSDPCNHTEDTDNARNIVQVERELKVKVDDAVQLNFQLTSRHYQYITLNKAVLKDHQTALNI